MTHRKVEDATVARCKDGDSWSNTCQTSHLNINKGLVCSSPTDSIHQEQGLSYNVLEIVPPQPHWINFFVVDPHNRTGFLCFPDRASFQHFVSSIHNDYAVLDLYSNGAVSSCIISCSQLLTRTPTLLDNNILLFVNRQRQMTMVKYSIPPNTCGTQWSSLLICRSANCDSKVNGANCSDFVRAWNITSVIHTGDAWNSLQHPVLQQASPTQSSNTSGQVAYGLQGKPLKKIILPARQGRTNRKAEMNVY